jgi:hypothetical protein
MSSDSIVENERQVRTLHGGDKLHVCARDAFNTRMNARNFCGLVMLHAVGSF